MPGGVFMRLHSWAMALIAAASTATAAGAADFSVLFSKDEIAIIHDYYADSHGDPDRGARGKPAGKPLPPGIAKNLARGKPLPPGIARQRLPDDLIRRLPPVRDGYERVIVDGRLLLVEIATQVIADIVADAIFR